MNQAYEHETYEHFLRVVAEEGFDIPEMSEEIQRAYRERLVNADITRKASELEQKLASN